MSLCPEFPGVFTDCHAFFNLTTNLQNITREGFLKKKHSCSLIFFKTVLYTYILNMSFPLNEIINKNLSDRNNNHLNIKFYRV